MLSGSGGIFICPKCGNGLEPRGNSMYCSEGHCYDVSKNGYVNLVLRGKKDSGDGTELIAARGRVMEKGYYRALYAFTRRAFAFSEGDLIVDAGTGDGSFAGKLKEYFPSATVVGTDLSKYAVSKAAKKYPDVLFAVANSAALPFADASVSAVFSVFTTLFAAEARRVLAKGGRLVRVTPGKNHLLEFKSALYDEVRLNAEDESVPEGFVREGTFRVEDVYVCVGGEIKDLAGMTPYSVKTAPCRLEKLYAQPELETRTEFRVDVFIKE